MSLKMLRRHSGRVISNNSYDGSDISLRSIKYSTKQLKKSIIYFNATMCVKH